MAGHRRLSYLASTARRTQPASEARPWARRASPPDLLYSRSGVLDFSTSTATAALPLTFDAYAHTDRYAFTYMANLTRLSEPSPSVYLFGRLPGTVEAQRVVLSLVSQRPNGP